MRVIHLTISAKLGFKLGFSVSRFALILSMFISTGAHAAGTFEEGLAYFDQANAAQDPKHEGYARAYAIWSDPALAEHSAAQYHLGVLHFYGLGGAEFDQYKGISLFRQSAEAGYHVAQAFMGFAAENGDDVFVAKDEAVALEWYQKAAQANHCVAIRRLEQAYQNGELGLSVNEDKAAEWRQRRDSCRTR